MKKTIMILLLLIVFMSISFAANKTCNIYYYADGQLIFEETLSVSSNDPVIRTVKDKAPSGYGLDTEKSTPLPYTLTGDSADIVVYYKSVAINYRVNYYLDGVSMNVSDTGSVSAGDPTVYKVTNKAPEGYSIDMSRSTPLPFKVSAENNVIEVYYKSDEIKYTVVYFKDGVNMAQNEQGSVSRLNPVVNTVPDKAPEGYVLNTDNSTKLPVTIKDDGQVISIFYSSNTLPYTVNYYVDGEKKKTLELKAEKENTEIKEVPNLAPEGYKPGPDSTPLPFKVSRFDNNINIYYIKDKMNYIIKFYKDGEDLEIDYKGTVSGDNPKVIKPPEDAPEGYVTDRSKSTKFPYEVKKDGDILEIYYVKNKLEYKVQYFRGDDKLDEDEKGNVSESDPVVREVIDKTPTGYVIDKEKSTPLPFTVTKDKNIIRVYYMKDKFTYKVKYFKDGDDMMIDEKGEGKVGDTVDSVKDNTPDGYVLDKEASTRLPYLIVNGDNVIKVHYVKAGNVSEKKGGGVGTILLIILLIAIIIGVIITAVFLYRNKKLMSENDEYMDDDE